MESGKPQVVVEHRESLRFPEMGVPLNHHPFRTMGFSLKKKPSSYGDTPILGNPHPLWSTQSHRKTIPESSPWMGKKCLFLCWKTTTINQSVRENIIQKPSWKRGLDRQWYPSVLKNELKLMVLPLTTRRPLSILPAPGFLNPKLTVRVRPLISLRWSGGTPSKA